MGRWFRTNNLQNPTRSRTVLECASTSVICWVFQFRAKSTDPLHAGASNCETDPEIDTVRDNESNGRIATVSERDDRVEKRPVWIRHEEGVVASPCRVKLA